MENKVRELGRVIDGKDARVLALSKDLKKAEEEVLREQKQRQNLQEQVRCSIFSFFVELTDTLQTIVYYWSAHPFEHGRCLHSRAIWTRI